MTADAREELTQLICLHTPYTGPRAQRAADKILEAGWVPARTPAVDRDALAEVIGGARCGCGHVATRHGVAHCAVNADNHDDACRCDKGMSQVIVGAVLTVVQDAADVRRAVAAEWVDFARDATGIYVTSAEEARRSIAESIHQLTQALMAATDATAARPVVDREALTDFIDQMGTCRHVEPRQGSCADCTTAAVLASGAVDDAADVRADERRKIYCGCGLCCASTPPERRGEWHKQHCQPRLASEVGGEDRG